jgi:hypothetical protein
MYDRTHKALDTNGHEVTIGDVVTSFRGERWVFDGISRVPGDGTATEGKVLVSEPGGGRRNRRELYRSVFNLTIVPRNTEE